MYVIERISNNNKKLYYNGGFELPILINEKNYSPSISKAMKFNLKRDAKLFCNKEDKIVKIEV
jgi:hypothetical protein